jgi:agmatine deiminase
MSISSPASPRPESVLMHDQRDPSHPDHAVTAEIRAILSAATDARGRKLEIIDLPAPRHLKAMPHGPVDWSYVNHLVVNGGVIACGFGEDNADTRRARSCRPPIPVAASSPCDAREIFARGGGIHCITQQQPKAGAA